MPTSARDITARINQLTFAQPMLRDIEVIETVRSLASRWSRFSSAADTRLARHRFHLIDAGRFTSALAPDSKAKPDIELLTYLHGAGRSETEKWLERSRGSVGRRASSICASTSSPAARLRRRFHRSPLRRVETDRLDCTASVLGLLYTTLQSRDAAETKALPYPGKGNPPLHANRRMP